MRALTSPVYAAVASLVLAGCPKQPPRPLPADVAVPLAEGLRGAADDLAPLADFPLPPAVCVASRVIRSVLVAGADAAESTGDVVVSTVYGDCYPSGYALPLTPMEAMYVQIGAAVARSTTRSILAGVRGDCVAEAIGATVVNALADTTAAVTRELAEGLSTGRVDVRYRVDYTGCDIP